jgi:hypothetical protein
LKLATNEDDEDDTDFNKKDTTYGQLLSCMEQNRKDESGQLTNKDEDLIHKHLLDIGSPDPKSQ